MTGERGKKRMNGWLKWAIAAVVLPLMAWALSTVRSADVTRIDDTAVVVNAHESRLDTLDKKVDSNHVDLTYKIDGLQAKVDMQYERQGEALKLLLEAGGVPRWRWPELDLSPDSSSGNIGGD